MAGESLFLACAQRFVEGHALLTSGVAGAAQLQCSAPAVRGVSWVADCVMSGAAGVGDTRGLFRKFDLRVPTTMEINPILNAIKDLSERSLSIRGYL